jgi:uncharacterized protein
MPELTPLPMPPANADTAPYFDGLDQGKLLIQRSARTGETWFYPRMFAPSDWSRDGIEWVEASGQGTVYSFSVIHRAPFPAFAERVPYVIALVDLAEGPRMMTNIVGEDALDIAIGDAVQVEFEPRGSEGQQLPQFRRVKR